MPTRQCHLVRSKTHNQEGKWTSGDGHLCDEHRMRLKLKRILSKLRN